LVWYLLYTRQIVQALKANAENISEVYAYVQQGLSDPVPPSSVDDMLFELQGIVLESELPMVLTHPGDTIIDAVNLPFEADLTLPEGQRRVQDYVRRIDQNHDPAGDPARFLIHFGETPETRSLRLIPFFKVGGLLLTAFLGLLAIRVQRRAEAERAWTAMARELAHQLGTPISSLQGWLELLSLPVGERPEEVNQSEIAREIGADLQKLEKISHRFELIGMEPELGEVDIRQVLMELQRYLEIRLPRRTAGVTLELDVADDLPSVRGNPVLLTWAFENLVKNSLDALGGTGGGIRIRARARVGKDLMVSVSDTGPGVPVEVRGEIFEPGVTTKEKGWGVGLALTRRIVEGVHRGRIELGGEESSGATFHVHLPLFIPRIES
jgi:signal transduction histidine kinase